MGRDGGWRQPATLAVPVFNEASGISESLHEVSDYLSLAVDRYAWQILVVDDGSSDNTLEVVEKTAYSLPVPLRLLAHDKNRGLGAALHTIFRHTRGILLVTIDADLTYDLYHVGRMVWAWETTGAAVVVASPYMVGGLTREVPPDLELRSRTANRYLSTVSHLPVSTYTGMVRAYDGVFARTLRPLRDGASVNVEVLHEAWRRGLKVVEVPATLDWTGQAQRRRRSRLLSLRSVWESAQVINDGRRLRRVARVRPSIPGYASEHRRVIALRQSPAGHVAGGAVTPQSRLGSQDVPQRNSTG